MKHTFWDIIALSVFFFSGCASTSEELKNKMTISQQLVVEKKEAIF